MYGFVDSQPKKDGSDDGSKCGGREISREGGLSVA